jgi:hypothetical protein
VYEVIVYFAVLPLVSVSFFTIVIRYNLRKKLNAKQYGIGKKGKITKKLEKKKDKAAQVQRDIEGLEKALKITIEEERMNNGFDTVINEVV